MAAIGVVPFAGVLREHFPCGLEAAKLFVQPDFL